MGCGRGGHEEERRPSQGQRGAGATVQKSLKAMPSSLDFYDGEDEESLDDFSHKSDIIRASPLNHSLLKWERPNLKECAVGLNVSGRKIQQVIKRENGSRGTQWERKGLNPENLQRCLVGIF